jgi:tetratricopeptide (TPR) repeat protein
MDNQTVSILDKTNKISLYLAVFLVPIFFLTFSQDFLGHPKHLLLIFLLTISFGAWFSGQLLQGKIVIKKQALFYGAAIFLLIAAGVSTVFSLWRGGSLWGWPTNMAESFVATASFLMLAFLIANSFQKEKELLSVIKLFIVSGAVAGLFTIFQTYGVFLLPFSFAGTALFNIMGAISSVALMASILLPISLFLILKSSRFWKVTFILSSFIFLLNLVLINFRTAWGILALVSMILLAFSVKTTKDKNAFIWIGTLMVLLTLSIFFSLFPFRSGFLPSIPIEVSPSIATEINILRGAFQESPKNVFLGTGPGTFTFNYSKFRSPAINQTPFWGNRFLKGSSAVLGWLMTQGIFGGAALLFLMGWAFYIAGKKIISFCQNKENFLLDGVFFASAIGLLVGGIFYSFNYVLWFAFWLYAGMLLFYAAKKEKKISLTNFPHKAGVFVLASVLIITVCLSALFIQARRYWADVNYFQGIRSAQDGKIDEALDYLTKAVEINPGLDVYWRELAQLYLLKADIFSRDEKLTEEQRQQLTYNAVARGAEAINRATREVPVNVANWNVKGYFYRNLIGIEGADELALSAYRKAIELEPSSPFAYSEIGRAYVLIAQEAAKKQIDYRKQEALSFAVENLRKAIQLKPDYSPAHYLLAVVYDQQGNLIEAIARLQETRRTSPHDSGVAFQLGLLYWRDRDLDKAEKEFKASVELMPDYSNAIYMLGLVYGQQGETEKARKEFEKVGRLNPENEEVQRILRDLEKGLPITDEIPLDLPIEEEVPEEINI